jgi:hypothetical protein
MTEKALAAPRFTLSNHPYLSRFFEIIWTTITVVFCVLAFNLVLAALAQFWFGVFVALGVKPTWGAVSLEAGAAVIATVLLVRGVLYARDRMFPPKPSKPFYPAVLHFTDATDKTDAEGSRQVPAPPRKPAEKSHEPYWYSMEEILEIRKMIPYFNPKHQIPTEEEEAWERRWSYPKHFRPRNDSNARPFGMLGEDIAAGIITREEFLKGNWVWEPTGEVLGPFDTNLWTKEQKDRQQQILKEVCEKSFRWKKRLERLRLARRAKNKWPRCH